MDARFSEWMLNVKGQKIFCKLRINPKNRNSFLLLLPDLPGYDHQASLPLVERLTTSAATNNFELPSIILFDFPGCGLSYKMSDLANECTVDNFAEVTAFVIEHIRLRGCPTDVTMRLQIYCESFGSIIAMQLPLRRPKWLRTDNNIRLTQIISCGGITGMRDEHHAADWLFQRYFHHPSYEAILKGMKKLFRGDIADHDDYISNIAIPLAPLFSQTYVGLPGSMLGKAMSENPAYAATLLKGIRYIGTWFGKDVTAIDHNLHHLTNVSIDVMKRFFATGFNRVDVAEMVEQHPDLYSRFHLVMIAGKEDCFVSFIHALALRVKLPDTSAAIILQDRHQTLSPPGLTVLDNLLTRLVTRKLGPNDLLDKFISYSQFPERKAQEKPTKEKVFTCSTKHINDATGVVTCKISRVRVVQTDHTAAADQMNILQPLMTSGSYVPISETPEQLVITRNRGSK